MAVKPVCSTGLTWSLPIPRAIFTSVKSMVPPGPKGICVMARPVAAVPVIPRSANTPANNPKDRRIIAPSTMQRERRGLKGGNNFADADGDKHDKDQNQHAVDQQAVLRHAIGP